MSIMSGKGSYEVRNSENGVDRVGRLRIITPFLFCYGDQGRSARHLSGNKDYSSAGEEKEPR